MLARLLITGSACCDGFSKTSFSAGCSLPTAARLAGLGLIAAASGGSALFRGCFRGLGPANAALGLGTCEGLTGTGEGAAEGVLEGVAALVRLKENGFGLVAEGRGFVGERGVAAEVDVFEMENIDGRANWGASNTGG